MRPILILLLLCSSCFAQIKIVELKSQTWAGLVKPVINEDGTITTGPDSKPILVSSTTRYRIETVVPYKFGDMEAIRIATGEEVIMDRYPSAEIYWFRSGATPGKYKLKYTGYDPVAGIAKDVFIVEHNVEPVIDPIAPVVPVVPVTGISEQARKSMSDYVSSMARDMRTVAGEIRSGVNKTSIAVQTRGQALDLLSRTAFKQSIGKLMNESVGDPPKPEVFEAIAIGYEAVK